MDQLTAGLEAAINSDDGDLVTANLCDVTGGGVTALAASWRSGVVVVARGAVLSVHDCNALEDAARVAFNNRDDVEGSAHLQASPAANLSCAALNVQAGAGAVVTVRLHAACTALSLNPELGCLAVGCADGLVLVARHIQHLADSGEAALVPLAGSGAEDASGPALLAWAGSTLMCAIGSGFGMYDWDGNELARQESTLGKAAVTTVAGCPFSSPGRALFAVGGADGLAEVVGFTGGVIEVVARGALLSGREGGSGAVEALAWVSPSGLAAVRRVGRGSDVSLQLVPVGFDEAADLTGGGLVSADYGDEVSGGVGSLWVGGGDGFDQGNLPTWHSLGEAAPAGQRVSLGVVGPLVVCATGSSAAGAPRATAFKVARDDHDDDDDDDDGARSGGSGTSKGAPRLRECGEWLWLPSSLGSGGGGALALAFGLQSGAALDARAPFRSGEGDLRAPVSVLCALRDGTLAISGVLCAGLLDTDQGTCAPFQPEVRGLPGACEAGNVLGLPLFCVASSP